MNILVTGAAGFIGSHLCEKLLDLQHKVFALDNFNDYYAPAIKRKNIEKALSYTSEYRLLEGDIRDKDFLQEIFAGYQIDLIVHLAAMAGVRPSIKNPNLYYEVNVMGTLNLLEYCRYNDIKRFILASSSSVYGNNPSIPFQESDPVDNPISPYAASKKAAELMCHCYHHLYNISIACLRYFTVYGPRQRPDLAIHKFTRLMYEDKPLEVFGDLGSSRDYTYIDDIIAGTLSALSFVSDNTTCEIFNLGESETVTLSRMINTLEKTLGRKAKIKKSPPQDGDVWQTYASLEKSKKLLGYNPRTKFDDGIRQFIDWFKKETE